MKRCWIGAGFLVGVLLAAILSTCAMDRWHSGIARDALRAGEAALVEDWPLALNLASRAEENWNARRNISAVLADHAPMERINAIFAQLTVYGAERDRVSFSALCAQLSRELTAMADAHGLQWWNVLSHPLQGNSLR